MKPRNCQWYLINLTHHSYASLRAQFDTSHRKTWPQNRLSISPNIAETKAAIKVDWGADSPLKPAPPMLIAEYDKDTHWKLQQLMAGPDWQPAEPEITGGIV